MIKQHKREVALRSFLKPALFYLSIATLLIFLFHTALLDLKGGLLVGIAFLGIWRYGLLITNYIRAFIYAKIKYPAYKKEIEKKDFQERFPDKIYFIIPSYKEDPWVTTEVFTSLIQEINNIPCEAVLVVSTSSDYEDSIILNVYESHPNRDKIKLIFQKQDSGKRIAMGHALRAVARDFNEEREEDTNSVTIFMDGDTYLPKDSLKNSLPFFTLDPQLGALTTNELGYVDSKSQWYKEWFVLKFAQRHILFQSHSLSKRVLTLTGRFSLFRTTAVISEEFISLIENDIIIDPNYGKFRFLMGDDKSSWYYMMKQGWHMLYLPDVVAYSLESRDGDFLEISRTLPYRWYGNTLRNNKRARALKNQPLFIKYLFYDQLALMWTSSAGILAMLLLTVFKSILYLPLYIAWIFIVRTIQTGVFALFGHQVSLKTLPLMLHGQWYGSYVKIRSFFNLDDQKWAKAGGEVQTANDDIAPIKYKIAKYYSSYRMYLFIFIFIFAIATLQTQLLKFPDIELFASPLNKQNSIIFEAKTNDNKDDAKTLNTLIQKVAKGSIILLPEGILDIYEPIIINRGDITLLGNKTTLLSHMHNKEKAIISIEGKKENSIGTTLTPTYNNNRLKITTSKSIKAKDILLVEEPNDEHFVKSVLGSQKWYKKYPILRSEIMEVAEYENGTILTQFVSKSHIDKGAKVYKINAVKNVNLKNITLDSIYKADTYKHIYKNIDENLMIDGIHIKYAAYVTLQNIKIQNSGSNPLVFERAYNCYGSNIFIDGSINKGKKGNGYLRFNKSFHNTLSDVNVKNIRHIVFQWASAYNTIKNLYTEVDINFHGGASHDNLVENVHFHVNTSKHKWGKIYRTPKNASWAPPDYDTNFVKEIKK
ncbi:glycosyltransferase [Sulfurimonas sp.]|uniref:glycosyltransferase n=1 Tax=Sulfurimonas sp. TaxID=2022749 RepID=UPI002632E6DD|nr:glycosyltransferase [Sulfurimonas sp.]